MEKTQKQIAQKYAGNLQYYKLLHPFRRWKARLIAAGVLSGISLVLFFFVFGRSTPHLESFYSSGKISQSHQQFARDCKACHTTVVNRVAARTSDVREGIDQSCQKCHTDHTFHQATVVETRSCTTCHHEHLGSGPMQPVADANCTTCHANPVTMSAAAEKGMTLPPESFHTPSTGGAVFFQTPRASRGATGIIHSFAKDHPEFAVQARDLKDPAKLRFNHAVHLSDSVPQINGKKLDCAFCHQPNGSGSYMQPVTFEQSCRVCHSLQLDPVVPGFVIPHPKGDSTSVRNFLLTLPSQYAQFAVEKKGMTQPAEVRAFVREGMIRIRERTRRGDDLVQDVFFSNGRTVNGTGAGGRPLYPGCAYCHEVKTVAGVPAVTPPGIPDRWFAHAQFDHSSHQFITCASCHTGIAKSSLTSDISLPDKASCVTCHSPKGGVSSTCATCHSYHNPDPALAKSAGTGSLREMMTSPR